MTLCGYLPVLVALAGVAAGQEATVDFVAEVAPILRQHCIKCHGPKKQKGDLRLDRRADIFPDQRDLWVIAPGEPAASALFGRITLPADDPDVMPAEGDHLSEQAVAAIKRWIAAGAEWPAGGDAAMAAGGLPDDAAAVAVPRPDAAAAARIEAALGALEERGAVAQRVAAGLDAVEVNLRLLREPVGDADLALLADLAPVLVWLDLSRSKVTDAGMAALTGLRELRRLHLSETAIGDAGLAHLGALPRLSVLNLHGTKVTDAGLDSLGQCGSLRKVFLWRTAVSADGAGQLRQQRPDLAVDLGDYAALRLQAATALVAEQQDRKEAGKEPINELCPVTGKPVDPAVTTEHQGRVVAFCCEKCRSKFVGDPAAYADKLK